jgi:hypothetical protein
MQDTNEKFDLQTLANLWQAPLVARSQQALDKFSGGLLNSRTLANEDCKGTGPRGRVKCGRKVAYPVDSLTEWMQAKQETAE